MKKFYYSSGILNGGMNNKKDDLSVGNNQLVEAQNIIFDENNNPKKRPGIFSSTTIGEEWKTGITESGKTKTTENLYDFVNGSGYRYLVAFAGTTVKYTTNMVDWYTIKDDFDTNFKVNFATFQNKLIMTNGKDEIYTWDGTNLLEANGFIAEEGENGVCSAGVHKIKITFEYAGVVYSYDTIVSITSSGSKTINLSKIPVPPIYSEKKTVWITKANETTNYYKVEDLTDISATTYTINVSDSSLSELYPSNTISVKPPKCKYIEVFENRLFLANSLDADSEVYWSEVGGLEFLRNNIFGIDVNDGKEITGIKTFKALNKILVWKQNGMWAGSSESDTFVFRNVSNVGCDFPYSIQEFNVSDEYGERGTLIWANNNGIWEWNGSNIRMISDQTNGSSIQKTWEKIKQKEISFKKNVITTDAQFNQGDFNTGASDDWLTIINGANKMEIKNVFTWNNSYGIKPKNNATITAMCWDDIHNRLFVVEQSDLENYEYFSYFKWNPTNKIWEKIFIHLNPTYHGQSGITIKIEYDAENDRVYGITVGGTIWRSQKGVARYAFMNNTDAKNFSVNGISGLLEKTETTSATITPITAGVSSYIKVIGDNNLNTYAVEGKKYVEIDSSTDITKALFISHTTKVKNEGNRAVYLKKVPYSGANQFRAVFSANGSFEGCNADITIGASQEKTVPAGFYCAVSQRYVHEGSLDMKLTYQRAGNVDMKIVGRKLYFVNCSTETFGGANYSKNYICYIDISDDSWNNAIATNVLSKSWVFLSKFDQYLYVTFNNAIWESSGFSSYLAVIDSINSPSTYTLLYGSVGEKHIKEINASYTSNYLFPTVVCSAYNISNESYEIGKIHTNNNTLIYTKVLENKMYNNSNHSLEIIKNNNRNLWYYIDDTTKELAEFDISGINNILYDSSSSPSYYNAIAYVLTPSYGSPDMIIPITDVRGNSQTSSAYWRGVVGNYTLTGSWLKTKVGSINPIDTGDKSIKLNSIFIDTSNVSDDASVYVKLYTSVSATDYINPRLPNNIMVPVSSGDTNIDGSSISTPDGGKITLTLSGKNRYVHEYIYVYYSINNIMNSVETSFVSPSINSIVLNWTDSTYGENPPETDVVSKVFNNKYYIAFIEKNTRDDKESKNKRNNIIAVMDRLKRWSFWRGRPCHVSCFEVYENRLLWGDAYLTGSGELESDYIYVLGKRGDLNGFADHDVSSNPPSLLAIDAYIITKNFDVFSNNDAPMFKKQLRSIYITSNTFDNYDQNTNLGSYVLEFGWRPDEKKYEADYNGNFSGDPFWYVKNIDVGVRDLTGKKNVEINFPNYQPAKRHQFRFRNNTIYQDLGFIKFELIGKIFNARG